MNATTLGSLTQFSNNEFTLDIISTGDSFKIAAPGLAKGLGFHAAKDMLRSVPESEKGWEIAPTPGGDQKITVLTESGFYRVVGQRQAARIKDQKIRAQVERFQNWIFGEVLPSIRRNGGYLTPAATEQALTDPDFIIQLATQLKTERARANHAEKQLENATPKIEYFDNNVDVKDCINFRSLAARLGVKERHQTNVLLQHGWIYRFKTYQWNWSRTEYRRRYQYRAYASKKHLFKLVPVHDVPLLTNGEVLQRLLITPEGVEEIRKAFARWNELPTEYSLNTLF